MRISDWSSDVCSSDLTLDWLERAIARATGRPFNILDAGSGYGDMLRDIHHWAARHGVEVRLTGIDLNRRSADAAMNETPAGAGIAYVKGDTFDYQPPQPPDIMPCSLSCISSHQPAKNGRASW